jgi:hypothetical protein
VLLLWKPEDGLYELVEADDREKLGVTCGVGWIWCWRGEDSGEPLDKEERSDDEEWMECNYRQKSAFAIIVCWPFIVIRRWFRMYVRRLQSATLGRIPDHRPSRTTFQLQNAHEKQ